FFSYYDKKIADYGLSDYLKHFNQFEDLIRLKRPKAIGEATPSYFWSIEPRREWSNPTNEHFNPHIPQSVHNILGSKTKLILCLRNPIHRAISAYFHHIKRDRIDYKTQSILEVGHLHGIIDMGFYAAHLKAWLTEFDLSNFSTLIYERDIKQNKQQTIEKICNFLGVDYGLFPSTTNLNRYHNKGLRYEVNEAGAFLIFPDRDEPELVVTPEDIAELKQIYAADARELEQILDTDLSKLWQLT
ncbi:MAG: sulfotransferase domain-containing protein, partial [Cyanobacteria bacterium J06623_7]